MLYDRQSKQIRELLRSPIFDYWVDEFVWSHDSKTIYLVSGQDGEAPAYRVNLSGGIVQLTLIGEFGDLHPTRDGKVLIASRMTVEAPAEVFRIDLFQTGSKGNHDSQTGLSADGKILTNERLVEPLTHLNQSALAQLDLPQMESFWFPSIGKVRVQGFLIKPPNFDPSKKYPVKFLIHGGPEGAWGDSWSYRWNAELLAANGYVAVMINPRGSTGYGQAFIDGVNGDWGGRPYIDLTRGLDYAEQHYSFIDKSRECALGASYGGYMANWILGHTDRFKCIVSHDGMFNPVSAYGTTEELWFNEWEFKGKPWDYYGKPASIDPYRKWSPASRREKLQNANISDSWPARLSPRSLGRPATLHHSAAAECSLKDALLS